MKCLARLTFRHVTARVQAKLIRVYLSEIYDGDGRAIALTRTRCARNDTVMSRVSILEFEIANLMRNENYASFYPQIRDSRCI